LRTILLILAPATRVHDPPKIEDPVVLMIMLIRTGIAKGKGK
jgi:hypothetical protein